MTASVMMMILMRVTADSSRSEARTIAPGKVCILSARSAACQRQAQPGLSLFAPSFLFKQLRGAGSAGSAIPKPGASAPRRLRAVGVIECMT